MGLYVIEKKVHLKTQEDRTREEQRPATALDIAYGFTRHMAKVFKSIEIRTTFIWPDFIGGTNECVMCIKSVSTTRSNGVS